MTTSPPVVTVVLIAAAALGVALLGWAATDARWPGNDIGYTPAQPIAFSHRLHAAELEVDCAYCHSSSAAGRYAGMPSGSTCMNCHRFVSAASETVKKEIWAAAREARDVRRVVSDAMRVLYLSQGLDESLQPIPGANAEPIEWSEVTRFPDLAYFHHGAHARVGIECQECHGEVQTMERTRQAKHLSMGTCVECHRESNRNGVNGEAVEAILDCVGCHR
jgi:hypothetical protein